MSGSSSHEAHVAELVEMMRCTVKADTGEKFYIDVEASDTIASIKAKIQENSRTSGADFQLRVGGLPLDDEDGIVRVVWNRLKRLESQQREQRSRSPCPR